MEKYFLEFSGKLSTYEDPGKSQDTKYIYKVYILWSQTEAVSQNVGQVTCELP